MSAQPAGEQAVHRLKARTERGRACAQAEREIEAAGRRQLKSMLEALMPRARWLLLWLNSAD